MASQAQLENRFLKPYFPTSTSARAGFSLAEQPPHTTAAHPAGSTDLTHIYLVLRAASQGCPLRPFPPRQRLPANSRPLLRVAQGGGAHVYKTVNLII